MIRRIKKWIGNNEEQFTDIIAHVLILLILFGFLVLLSSCSKVIYRDIEKVTTDTLYIQKVDSVVNTIFKERIKEVFIVDSSVTIVDDSGNVKGKERWRTKYVNVENRDSIDFYKSKLDSLSHKQNKKEKEEKIMEKKENMFDSLKQFFIAFLIVLSFCFFYKITSLWLKK